MKRMLDAIPACSILLLCACTALAAPPAQQIWPDTTTVASSSGQFTVQGKRWPTLSAGEARLATNASFVRLEPTLVAVSGERIKQLLNRELAVTAPWQGNIYVTLHLAESVEDEVTITCDQFRDGWQYRVELPVMIERDRYVRAMVQVLLLEQANRHARAHSAEAPLWLTEGLTRQLLATSEIQIILPPPGKVVNGLGLTITNVSARREDPLKQAHQALLVQPPLSFEALSWPAPDQLSGEAAELYRNSAQLFVGELLRLPDGAACLRAMLADLPEHYNWQFAFLHGFQAYFDRQLDVEKWWAVQSVHFTGRDLSQTWPLAQSLQKLDEALRTTVEVRAHPNELPLHLDVTLQTILREWEPARQSETLQNKVRELGLLRLQVARELAGLVEAYRQSLETVLQHHEETVLLFFRKQASRNRAVQQAIKELDALDARRDALRRMARSVAVAP